MNDMPSNDKPVDQDTRKTIPSENGKRFSELYDGNEDVVYKFVNSQLRNSKVPDVFQAVLVQGIEKVDTLKSPEGFLPWMYSVVKTTVADDWRKTKRMERHEQLLDEELNPHHVASMDFNPENAGMNNEKLAMLDAAMNDLDPDSHLAITLRFTENKSYKEIAAII